MEYWARWMRKRLQPNCSFLSIFQKNLTENVDRFARKRFFIHSAQSLSFLIACYRSQSPESEFVNLQRAIQLKLIACDLRDN